MFLQKAQKHASKTENGIGRHAIDGGKIANAVVGTVDVAGAIQ